MLCLQLPALAVLSNCANIGGGGVPDMPPIADFLANAVFLFHFVEHRYSLSVLIDGNIAYISEVMSAEMCTY